MPNFAAVLVGVLAVSSAISGLVLDYKQGKVYEYRYHFDAATGPLAAASNVSDATMSFSSLVFFASRGRQSINGQDLLLMDLTVRNVRITDSDKDTEGDVYAQMMNRYPTAFAINVTPESETHGQIVQVQSTPDEPTWSSNLKRGIMSALQLTLNRHEGAYSVNERDAAGDCVVSYTASTNFDSNTLMVTKRKRNGDNCRPAYTVNAHNAPSLEDALTSESTMQYSVSLQDNVVANVIFEDLHIYEPHGKGTMATRAISSGTLTLLGVTGSKVDTVESMAELSNVLAAEYKLPEMSTFVVSDLRMKLDGNEHNGDEENQSRIGYLFESNGAPDVKPIFEKLQQVAKDRKAHPRIFIEVVNEVYLNRRYADALKPYLEDAELRAVLLDVLISVERIYEFNMAIAAVTARADVDETLRILIAVGYIKPDKNMYYAVKKFVTHANERVVATSLLTLGAMVRQSVDANGKLDRYSQATLTFLDGQLKAAELESDAVVILHAMGNSNHTSVRNMIEKYVVDRNVTEQVRSVAYDIMERVGKHDVEESGMQAKWGRRRPIQHGPLYQKSDEVVLVGNTDYGALAGYDLALYNPLSPEGEEGLLAQATAYGRAFAFKRKFSVFDGTISLAGDVMGRNKPDARPIESWFFYSIGGVIWTDCIDLIGQACVSRVPDNVRWDGKCRVQERNVVSWSGRLARFIWRIPLIQGISLDLTQTLGLYVNLDAHVSVCPMKADTGVLPTIGLDIVGKSAINAQIVEAAAEVDAKVMYTDLDAQSTLNMWPTEWCSNLHMRQNPIKARFELLIRARTDVKYCGRWPCGLGWGDGITWGADWPGFSRGQIDRDLKHQCTQIKFPARGRRLVLQQ